MTDPRVRAYADLLLDYSIGVQPGWHVLVATTVEAVPLARELSSGLGRRGAWCLLRMTPGNAFPADLDWIEAAPAAMKGVLPPLELDVLDRVDASIFALAPSSGREPADGDAQRAFAAHTLAWRRRGRSDEIPSVRCDFPCPAYAERAGMALSEYEDSFYAACLRDWPSEAAAMEPIRDRLSGAREVRITGRETDLRLSLDGRRGRIDDGHVNVPGGEVYFCPVEDSVEGTVLFDVPGAAHRDVRLVLRGGAVVEATAAEGQERLDAALAADEGARRFGELGIGCNDGIGRPTRNVLFDEKLAGTVHLALGDGFPQLGGRNRSDIHWDLIKDMRAGGELWAEGELVQRDGVWL